MRLAAAGAGRGKGGPQAELVLMDRPYPELTVKRTADILFNQTRQRRRICNCCWRIRPSLPTGASMRLIGWSMGGCGLASASAGTGRVPGAAAGVMTSQGGRLRSFSSMR